MGRCESLEIATDRKNRLINLGINESSIRIHPDNDPTSNYVVNVVGTLIGEDRLIKHELMISKVPKLRAEIEAIKRFKDPQSQHLFLKWCLSMKINHTLRSTPPSLTNEYVEAYDQLKKSLLEDITGKDISERQWTQACFPTKDSGLGYQNVKATVHPAFIAALYQAENPLRDLGLNINESDNPICVAFRESLRVHSELAELDTPLTKDSINAIPIGEGETLQCAITSQQTKVIKKNHTENTNDTKELAWLVSLSDSDSMSSRWLDVCPKKEYCTFTPNQFICLLQYRLFMRQNQHFYNSRCTCKNAPVLDPQGHHLSMGCAKEGTYYKLHDSLKFLWREFFSLSGTMVRLEEQGCFQEAYPENNKRPDISLLNLNPHKKIVCDISVAHPYPITGANTLTRVQALQPLRSANNTFQRKINTYQHLCDANNLEFRPLIFESTGKLHPTCRATFDNTIKLMMPNDHSHMISITKHYWSSRFSCCFQKCIADAFLSKTRAINGNLIRNCRYHEGHLGSYRLPHG